MLLQKQNLEMILKTEQTNQELWGTVKDCNLLCVFYLAFIYSYTLPLT